MDGAQTVYVVTEYEDYGCPRILGIFAAEDAAVRFRDAQSEWEILPPIPDFCLDEHRVRVNHEVKAFSVEGA